MTRAKSGQAAENQDQSPGNNKNDHEPTMQLQPPPGQEGRLSRPAGEVSTRRWQAAMPPA